MRNYSLLIQTEDDPPHHLTVQSGAPRNLLAVSMFCYTHNLATRGSLGHTPTHT